MIEKKAEHKNSKEYGECCTGLLMVLIKEIYSTGFLHSYWM